jgi:predicted RNA-binding protein with PIN domain
LNDPDDEPKLTEFVQQYCRLKRISAELFFDGALPGFSSGVKGGLVHVHPIRKGNTADQAMIDFLGQKGKLAHNYTVVSSDHHVQNQCRSLGAAILPSEQFARDLVNALSQSEKSTSADDKPISASEVNEWLAFFSDPKNKRKS